MGEAPRWWGGSPAGCGGVPDGVSWLWGPWSGEVPVRGNLVWGLRGSQSGVTAGGVCLPAGGVSGGAPPQVHDVQRVQAGAAGPGAREADAGAADAGRPLGRERAQRLGPRPRPAGMDLQHHTGGGHPRDPPLHPGTPLPSTHVPRDPRVALVPVCPCPHLPMLGVGVPLCPPAMSLYPHLVSLCPWLWVLCCPHAHSGGVPTSPCP